MSFERYRVQVACERLVGARDLDDWARKRSDFEALTLSDVDCSALAEHLREDAKDIYFKGVLSLCDAVCSIKRNLYSWATVKLYYAVFYFLRTSLAAKGYAIIRNRSLYLLSLRSGERPKKKSSARYRNDHFGTINIYRDIFERSDILESNTIDGLNAYEWLMERRNQVHYRERVFHDPGPAYFLNAVAKYVESKKLESLITLYIDDPDYLYCFQPEHACLALPIKRAILTKRDLLDEDIRLGFNKNQTRLLHTLVRLKRTALSTVVGLVSSGPT